MLTKLFVGTRFTSELKMRIGSDLSPMTAIPYEGKEYIGYYLESNPTVAQIRTCCDEFLIKLQEHCPEHRVDNLPIVVFPQAFVG